MIKTNQNFFRCMIFEECDLKMLSGWKQIFYLQYTVTFGKKGPKLNSSPVYGLQLYGNLLSLRDFQGFLEYVTKRLNGKKMWAQTDSMLDIRYVFFISSCIFLSNKISNRFELKAGVSWIERIWKVLVIVLLNAEFWINFLWLACLSQHK